MRIAIAFMAFMVAAASAQTMVTEDGFQSCRRITFDGDNFPSTFLSDVNRDTLLNEFGIVDIRVFTTVTNDDNIAENYNSLGSLPGRIFDTSSPTGGDSDLGSPNVRCQEACLPEWAGCPVCNEILLNGRTEFENTAGLENAGDTCLLDTPLPSGQIYDYAKCPGIGCGGGRFIMAESDLAANEVDHIGYAATYPNFGSNNDPSDQCEYVLTEQLTNTGEIKMCPSINIGMNCRDADRVLIANQDGGDPNDRAFGAVIEIEFEDPVQVLSAAFLDADESTVNDQGEQETPGFVYIMESATENTFDLFQPLVGFGDNSRNDIDFFGQDQFAIDIRRLVVWFSGSGSVNDIEYCSGTPPTVNITTEQTCKFDWSVTKTVEQLTWNLFAGESTSEVFNTTVTRSEECVSTDRTASGVVSTASPDSRNHMIVDVLGGFSATPGVDAAAATVQFTPTSCDPYIPTSENPFVLVATSQDAVVLESGDRFEPGNTLTCEFTTTVSDDALNGDMTSFMRMEFTSDVTSVATITGASIIASGQVMFGSDVTIVDETATLSDPDNADFPIVVSSTGSYLSTLSRDCLQGDNGKSEEFSCIATVTPTDNPSEATSDDASATLNCFEIDATKTASGSFRRSYDWTIQKSATPFSSDSATTFADSPLDGDHSVMYSYVIMATETTDNYALAGTVTLSNSHPDRENTATIQDISFPGATFLGSCAGGVATVPAADGIECPFIVENLVDGSVTVNEIAVTSAENVTYERSSDEFAYTGTTINDTVVVVDTFVGDVLPSSQFGPYTASQNMLATQFMETRTFSPNTCTTGEDQETTEYPNTAVVQHADTGFVFDSDDWVVTVVTDCLICPDCDIATAPMYPMALTSGTEGGRRVDFYTASSNGEKKVTLCWD